MNASLWVVAIVAAAISFAAAVNKLMQPKEKMLEQGPNMAWVEDFSDATLKRVGALEMLGALGLIVPQASGVAEVLTPIAAVGLILLQLGALVTHVRRREFRMLVIIVPLILALAYVAIGRFANG